MQLPELPVTEVLSDLADALECNGAAVLIAPPGAGKTTLVPLILLERIPAGRIILVEPRRIAARAAARRMASLLGEAVGKTVGYAVRFDSVSSDATRILVVTDGVFSRMALDDPELTGIAAVLFDEFHERSLDVDFGLALALDIREAFRPELKLIVMSATLDALPVAKLLGNAPVIESMGRSFPVELRYLPRKPDERIEDAMASAIRLALRETDGDLLAFLPGRAEINRTVERLNFVGNIDVYPLHGDLDGALQDAAIQPSVPGRRKVVLATTIAESSITIDGVRGVIDSGLARLPRFEPASGLTRLETVRVSRASADQRAGRAGRTAPGIAWRLWHDGQIASLPPAPPPAILEADLTGLLLDCAAFGADPRSLRLIDPPPEPALAEARRLLTALGALDEGGRPTAKGEAMRRMPLPPRLSAMVVEAAGFGAARLAAELALLIAERGLGGPGADLERRLHRFRNERGKQARDATAFARRLAAMAGGKEEAQGISAGRVLAAAFPDRIAQARGERGKFRLANGSGAQVDETDPLAGEPWLVVADLTGRAGAARIQAAAPIRLEEIEEALGDRIETITHSRFDRASGTIRRRGERRLGSMILSQAALPPPSGEEANMAIVEVVRAEGLDILPWTESARNLKMRLDWLHRTDPERWLSFGEADLLRELEGWLLPFLPGKADLAAIGGERLEDALRSRLPYDLVRRLEEFAPARYATPAGSRIAIRYEEDSPVLAVRLQELYGLKIHPAIAEGKVPLVLELLSPAGRPVQVTRDLPGFWQGSWKEVRAQMRGRYPKHFWPENPQEAEPTTRARRKQV